MVSHFEIEERATMFAKDAFDPSDNAPEDFYDALAAAQKKENERREAEKKSRGWADRNVAFVSGGGETASHTTPFAWCTPFLKEFSRRHSSPALPFQRLTGKTFD